MDKQADDDRVAEEILTDTVSDEAVERAAGRTACLTPTFNSITANSGGICSCPASFD